MKKLPPCGIRKTVRYMICIQISCRTSLQQFEIKPGETRTVFELNQGGRIAGIELNPATGFEGLTKSVDIKITWDDEKYPAVLLPCGGFLWICFWKIIHAEPVAWQPG